MKHYEGKGGQCGARSQSECGCDLADWRSAREVQLEEKLKVAKNSLGYAKYHLENGRVSSAIYFVDEALERMGGE